MRKNIKIISIFILLAAISIITGSTRAANLTNMAVAVSGHTAGKTAVTHTITFKPATNIPAPGDLKISYDTNFILSSVSAAADITVSGGGVTWNAVQSGDLNITTRVITLGWSSGTLTAGSTVTVTIKFIKNPASDGAYNLTVETGPDGFATATDSRTVPLVVTPGGVAVSASIPFAAANPTITNINPAVPIIISSGASQVISFVLTDVNNDDLDYAVIPSETAGSISASPSPAGSPPGTLPGASYNTANGTTITFTFFADGGTGSQTITVTVDDNQGGGLVTVPIDLFII